MGYQCGNGMKDTIDKVAGAKEQKESEVRGWLMETRPREVGEKNARVLERDGRQRGAEKRKLHKALCSHACRQSRKPKVRCVRR